MPCSQPFGLSLVPRVALTKSSQGLEVHTPEVEISNWFWLQLHEDIF